MTVGAAPNMLCLHVGALSSIYATDVGSITSRCNQLLLLLHNSLYTLLLLLLYYTLELPYYITITITVQSITITS